MCNLSIWPETYSYTLTETISSGVPVLALDIGAVAERIQQHKFGWVVNVNSTNKDILNKIVEICENVEEYKIKIDNLDRKSVV